MSLSTGEKWLPIPGFEGYEVSDRGRVQSFWKVKSAGFAMGATSYIGTEPKILVPYVQKNKGYLVVGINRGKKRVARPAHQLVLEAFVGPKPGPRYEACHDPDRTVTNNHLSNLRWDTKKANCKDQERHGTKLKGSLDPNARLQEADIPRIRAMLASGMTQTAIAAVFSVSPGCIGTVARGECWSHVKE